MTHFNKLKVMMELGGTIYNPVEVSRFRDHSLIHINDSMGRLLAARPTLEEAIDDAYACHWSRDKKGKR